MSANRKKKSKPRPVVGVFEFSNFAPFEIQDGSIVYPTVEHYYQAQKTTDKDLQKRISEAQKPGIAKKMGRRIPPRLLRKDWNTVRMFVMRSALEVKFYEGTRYHEELMDIWYPLVEYNRWHDNFWGHCLCVNCIKKPFQNHLGKMLDDIRLRWEFEYARRRKAYADLGVVK